jgi:hypothetical protein
MQRLCRAACESLPIEDLYRAGAEQVIFAGMKTLLDHKVSAWLTGKFPNDARVEEKVSAMLFDKYSYLWHNFEFMDRHGHRFIDIWLWCD